MTSPLLSVVVPTYNVLPWIDQTLDSLFSQGVDLEVIVVDDDSSDGTRERLQERAATEPRLIVEAAVDAGGAHARNQGVRSARGRYLAFADGDDLVPRGAYAAMVASLDSSGSDMVVGDYLKFNTSRTWRPTARWPDYQLARRAVQLVAVPSLIRGRACWNRVFRTEFWVAQELAFPEVPRSNDIEPMTRAMLSAGAIDIVEDVVYLYRDRPGQTSMSHSAGADRSAQSYFEQEAACARLIADAASPALDEIYSALVFDSDTWVHLSRYLHQLPAPGRMPPNVGSALSRLMGAVSRTSLNNAAAHRRALFLLLEAGESDLAFRFNEVTGSHRTAGSDGLGPWAEATAALAAMAPTDLDLSKFLQDGLLTQLVDHARQAPEDGLREAVEVAARDLAVQDTLRNVVFESSVIQAMAQALLRSDIAAIRRVSAVQEHSPLIVDEIRPSRRSLVVSGDMPSALLSSAVQFTALAQDDGDATTLHHRLNGSSRFETNILARDLAQGRHEMRINVRVDEQIVVEVAVATARMPIPTQDSTYALQALSDRRRSWRLIIDRRGSLASRVLGTLRNRVRAVIATRSR